MEGRLAYRLFGFALMHQAMNPRLLLINYHYVREGHCQFPGIHPLHPDEFRRQVEMLRARFHIASPEEISDFALGRKQLSRDSVFLTFDDGLREQAEIARQVLEPLRIRAAFFACSRPALEGCALSVHKVHWLRAHTEPAVFAAEFFGRLPVDSGALLGERHTAAAAQMYIYDSPEIGRVKYAINFLVEPKIVEEITSQMLAARGIDEGVFCRDLYMDEADLKRLTGDGHVVGVHGHAHLPFSRLAGDDLREDVRKNLSFLDSATGVRPAWVSYPYGREDAIPTDGVLEALFAEFQLQLGVTLTGSWNEWPLNPRRLHRINTNEVDGVLLRAKQREGQHHAS